MQVTRTPPCILEPLAALDSDCEASGSVGTVTACDWLTEADEQDQPIATGLFDAGDRVAIVGQSKARKSFYALQLAVSVCTGKPFLGIETVKQRVLLVNGEIVARSYKKRLRRMLARLGADAASLDGLFIANASEDSEAWTFRRVLSLAKSVSAAVAVVDPAYLLLGDEVNQAEVKDAVRGMKAFASAGVTLISVFHAAKGKVGDRQVIDRISGSGIFARDCSTLISLVEHANEVDHAVMQAVARNYPPVAPMTVRFEDGAFEVAYGVAPTEKTSATKPRKVYSSAALRECFTEEPQAYAAQLERIRSQLGCGRDRAKEEVARAVHDRLAVAEPRGRQTFYTLRTDVD